MGMNNVIELPDKPRCQFCKKRTATKQCDMPIGRKKNLHISETIKLPEGAYVKVTDYEKSFKEYTLTCDKYLCDKCATSISKEVDFCPSCMKKIKNIGGI